MGASALNLSSETPLAGPTHNSFQGPSAGGAPVLMGIGAHPPPLPPPPAAPFEEPPLMFGMFHGPPGLQGPPPPPPLTMLTPDMFPAENLVPVEVPYRARGTLKFFNDQREYGFIVSELDGSDVFFHYDDIKKTNLQKEFLRDAKNQFNVIFAFNILAYYGKYNFSKKAVDIELIKIEPKIN